MAQTITLYKVFLASPSDLNDERELLEEIVEELNLSTFNNSGIKIELVKWETHVNPGIGKYPQQVVNTDINNDYDIFIGLLWSKFGTPTQEYTSGTEEEFYSAYSKYQESPLSVSIMFYFKQAAIPMDKIDTEGIDAIRKFKSSLGEKGVLYWDYNTIEEFQKLLRIQLARKIQEIHEGQNKPTTKIDMEEEIEDEELGLLDYMEQGEENFDGVKEILYRMTDAIEWIGKRFTEKTDEIKEKTTLNPNLSSKAKRRLINVVANDLYSFNTRLKTEIPLFAKIYKNGIDNFSNAIKISIDLKADEEEDIDKSIDAIKFFITSIEESSQVCKEFRNSIDNFPRMTKEFNSAKRLSSQILADLVNEFDIAINLANALKIEFEDYKSKY